MCTITHLGDTRSIIGRYIGSMAVNMLADIPPQLDRYVGRVADRGISAVYRSIHESADVSTDAQVLWL